MFSALKVLTILFFIATLFIYTKPAQAATDWNATYQSNFSLRTIERGVICELAGVNPPGQEKCVGEDKDGKLSFYNYSNGGALGQMTSIMVALYNPPTSTVDYLADVGTNFGLIKSAYAQSVAGSGEGIIRPVRNLWQVTRNIAYLGFIFIFLVVGFMIMFRQKINPQTVISAQAALPGLVVGLLLVTFSYFIAALLIDLAFVGVQLVAQIFIQVINSGTPNVFGDGNAIQGFARDSNIFHLFLNSAFRIQNFGEITGGIFRTLGGWGSGVILPGIIGALAAALVFWPAGVFAIAGGAAIGAGITVIIGLIVPLILIIALMIQFFRLLFGLISTYIQLLIGTITGPLIILMASVPGRGGGLANWWKSLVANALVFPAVFGAFLFAGMILGTPPQQFTASPPLFGGLNTELLRLIVAYGLILGTPAIPDMVRGAFGIKGQNPIVQVATAGALAGVGVARAGYGAATSGFRGQAEAYAKQREGLSAGTVNLAGAAAAPRRPWYRFFGVWR